MTQTNDEIAKLFDVLPDRGERLGRGRGRGRGGTDDALALCRTWPGPLAVDRTAERWAGSGAKGQVGLL